jgi:hypothetical protein
MLKNPILKVELNRILKIISTCTKCSILQNETKGLTAVANKHKLKLKTLNPNPNPIPTTVPLVI